MIFAVKKAVIGRVFLVIIKSNMRKAIMSLMKKQQQPFRIEFNGAELSDKEIQLEVAESFAARLRELPTM